VRARYRVAKDATLRADTLRVSREYQIHGSEFLVLLSDKASHFAYANPAYLRASGYAWEELRGTVTARMLHKDVPLQVQHDMRRTLRAREPWTGVIKNRCKNGDYYWLRLNMSPLFSNGMFAGTLLVHSKASHEEIEHYDALYALLRAHPTLALSHGRAVRANVVSRFLDRIRNRGLAARIWISLAILNTAAAVGMFASGALMWTGRGAFLAASAVLGVHLIRTIVLPLNDAVRLANRIAAGDLGANTQSSRSDQIGALTRALMQMSMNIRATVLDIREGVQTMQLATGKIGVGTQDLSARTEEQASHLTQTAAAIEHISSTVKSTANATHQASEFAKIASAAAESGGQVVARVIDTMNGITQSSRKIAEIIGVIDSIAFQTNILALNAAVEAARAGEHGRGFAVVAAEVRSLAQRSAKSAREIKALISASVEQIDQGSALVNSTGGSIDNVVAQVRRVTELVGSVADATVRQAQGVDEIMKGVASLDAMTQDNAFLVEDNTSLATSLSAQTERLAQAVAVFKLSHEENLQLFESTKLTADQGMAQSLEVRAA
jgi:aerotaxis receptor